MVPRHQCENCLEYMQVEKTSEGYVLKCPECESAQEKDNEEN